MTFHWYVAQTYPNAEAAAERRLNRQLFATHLPCRTTRVPRHGKIAEHVEPCFPGYLFILLDVVGETWKGATYTRGVLRLLPVSDNPIAVRTEEVLELHQAELDGGSGIRDRRTGIAAAGLSRGARPPGDRVPRRP
jgi:transcriptional antiterminator RfaH